MALFPNKLLEVLGELDEESACLVIVNNIEGLPPQQRHTLRSLMLSKDEAVMKALALFRCDHQTEKLIGSLQEVLKNTSESSSIEKLQVQQQIQYSTANCSTDVPPSSRNHGSSTGSFAAQNTDVDGCDQKGSSDSLSQPIDSSPLVPPVLSVLPVPPVQHNDSCNNTSPPQNASYHPHNTIDENSQESGKYTEECLSEDSGAEESGMHKESQNESKIIDPAESPCSLAKAHTVQQSPDASQVSQKAKERALLLYGSPYDFAKNNNERERRLKASDRLFKDTLKESQKYLQHCVASPRTPAVRCRSPLPESNSRLLGLRFRSPGLETLIRSSSRQEGTKGLPRHNIKNTSRLERTVLPRTTDGQRAIFETQIMHTTQADNKSGNQSFAESQDNNDSKDDTGDKGRKDNAESAYNSINSESCRESDKCCQGTTKLPDGTADNMNKSQEDTAQKLNPEGQLEQELGLGLGLDLGLEGEGKGPEEIGDREEGAAELTATAHTEELFKKYLLEKPSEKGRQDSLLELSYASLLRYFSCPEVLSRLHAIALSNQGLVSKVNFIATLTELFSLHFPNASVTDSEILNLSRIYGIWSAPEEERSAVGFDELIGGISLLCKGRQEDNILETLSYLSQHKPLLSPDQLEAYLKSVYKIAIQSIPNSVKAAHISLNELSHMVVLQFLEDIRVESQSPSEGVIGGSRFVQWVLVNRGREPKKMETLKADILNDSMEISHKSVLGSGHLDLYPCLPSTPYYSSAHSSQHPFLPYHYPLPFCPPSYPRGQDTRSGISCQQVKGAPEYYTRHMGNLRVHESFLYSSPMQDSNYGGRNLDSSIAQTIDCRLPPDIDHLHHWPYSDYPPDSASSIQRSVKGSTKRPGMGTAAQNDLKTGGRGVQLEGMPNPYSTFDNPRNRRPPPNSIYTGNGIAFSQQHYY